ncbi:MAG: AFG1/ZapE family ATPase [Myxococcota bacterium]
MTTTCERCHGIGYFHVAGGDMAKAEVCSCRRECEACHGARFVIVEDGGYEVARPCRCQGVFQRVALFNEAGIPAGYGTKSIPGYSNAGGNQGRVKTLMERYQRKFDPDASRGLVLIGPVGTGKTHLVAGLLHYLCLERGVKCRFVDFFHLTSRIRATYDGSARETQEDVLRPLVNVPVLAIDELGKGLGTTWELNIVDELISRRYNAGRVIVATTNYPPAAWLQSSGGKRGRNGGSAPRGAHIDESLEERIGVRAWSRLAEMCEVLRVKGPDYRLRARK